MLNVDKFFCHVLRSSDELTELTDGRIFNPARDIEDDEEDKVPYIIVSYDSGSSSEGYKDTRLATLDSATVSVMCVSGDRDSLSELVELVEETIASAFDNYEDATEGKDWSFEIVNAQESASAVSLDVTKPCCYQTLTYNCETIRR